MKIEIEEYRGQTIKYDDDADKFVCDISIEDWSKSAKRGSLKDLRKEIDLHIKQNLNFKPFKALQLSKFGGDSLKIVEVSAIRTDGKLIVSEGGNYKSHVGKKDSEYLMKYDGDIVAELDKIEEESEAFYKLKRERTKELCSKLVKLDLSKYDLA